MEIITCSVRQERLREHTMTQISVLWYIKLGGEVPLEISMIRRLSLEQFERTVQSCDTK